MLDILFAATVMGSTDPPCDDEDGGFVSCVEDGGGAYVGLSQEKTYALAATYPPGNNAANPVLWYEFVAVIACDGNTPAQPRLEICGSAIQYCETFAPESPGPHSLVYRRIADSEGPVSGWDLVGQTCFTPSVPARSGEPAQELTEAMIINAFHRTDFALPQTILEPPGGRTLVNLPVYFELSWPEAGFQPDEVDTTTLAGHEVRIRPTLVGISYVTGDGTTIGPTTDMGGPYPGGSITHTYTAKAAGLNPYISVEYGGEVSVDGGEWRSIPATATVEGPTTTLEVLTSRNRLYSDNG
ncbi:hypothetical protein [Ornithinimicrobium panacihumi]|uniref:hypothetical protein n=1 Tax=Ornithinimicrobium panacihumi TaxID=2008449 RepID=UPI003F8C2626